MGFRFIAKMTIITNQYFCGMFDLISQVEKRKSKLVVVGIPKTIDNDIQILDKTFGFDTAVEEAQRAINAAYVEVMDNGSH